MLNGKRASINKQDQENSVNKNRKGVEPSGGPRVRTGIVWCSDVFGNHEGIHFVNGHGQTEVIGLDIGETIL